MGSIAERFAKQALVSGTSSTNDPSPERRSSTRQDLFVAFDTVAVAAPTRGRNTAPSVRRLCDRRSDHAPPAVSQHRAAKENREDTVGPHKV
jgi:hypothetical protein